MPAALADDTSKRSSASKTATSSPRRVAAARAWRTSVVHPGVGPPTTSVSSLWLSGRDVQVLSVVGRFRSVFAHDLRDTVYDGKSRPARRSLDKLVEQGLINQREWSHARHQWGPHVTLAGDGKRLLDRAVLDPDRPIERDGSVSAGWHKLRELTHDSTLYHLYTQARHEIEADGGRVIGLQLETDLKARLFSAIETRVVAGETDRDAIRAEVAAAQDLPTVDSGCQLPDLRLEVEHQDGRVEVRDLELATEHYHRGHLAAKQQAGFTVYRLGARRSHSGSAAPDGSRLYRLP